MGQLYKYQKSQIRPPHTQYLWLCLWTGEVHRIVKSGSFNTWDHFSDLRSWIVAHRQPSNQRGFAEEAKSSGGWIIIRLYLKTNLGDTSFYLCEINTILLYNSKLFCKIACQGTDFFSVRGSPSPVASFWAAVSSGSHETQKKISEPYSYFSPNSFAGYLIVSAESLSWNFFFSLFFCGGQLVI